jgi:hypothetical protein
MTGANEPGNESKWRRPDVLTLVAIVVACVAAVGASITALVVQRRSESSAQKALRTAGEYTAFVYLASLEQTKCGLTTSMNNKTEYQPFVPLSTLAVSVGDGIAMFDAKAPPNTVSDFGRLYGQLEVLYTNYDQQHIGRATLNTHDKARIHEVMPFLHAAESDLEQIPTIGAAGAQQVTGPNGCGQAP